MIIPNNVKIGEGAFKECQKLRTVKIGNNVVIGTDAFRLTSESNWSVSSRNENGQILYYYIYTSALHSLEIGNNVTIGNGAFYGAAELETVVLGEGVTIGNEAFFNAAKLKNIDLSKVVSIGDHAFSSHIHYEYLDTSFSTIATDEKNYYKLHYYAPIFTSIDLSSAVSVGANSFAYCHLLTDVKLGDQNTEITDGMFMECKELKNINLAGIETIGIQAFAQSALTNADLSA